MINFGTRVEVGGSSFNIIKVWDTMSLKSWNKGRVKWRVRSDFKGI